MLSSTQVLSKYIDWSKIPRDHLMKAQDRGTRVHAACSALCNNLFYNNLLPEEKGYLDSFRKWKEKYIKKIFWTEKRLYCDKLNFTGQPDIYCEIEDGRRAVIDLKTPIFPGPTWSIQLSSYRYLIIENKEDEPDIAISLRLKKDGSIASAHEYLFFNQDFAAFLNALTAHRYILGD